MRNTRTSRLLALISALTLGLNQAPAQERPGNQTGDNPGQEKKTGPSGQAIMPETLRAFLDGMGYENQPIGNNIYELKLQRDNLNVYVAVSISPNRSYLWLSAWFAPFPDPDKVPNEVWLRILEENEKIGPAYFAYNRAKKQLYLLQPLENHDLTPERFRPRLEGFASLVPRTQHLWSPDKWSAAAGGPGPQPAVEVRKEKLGAISVDDYKKIFLDADDLPGMKNTQDSRTRGAERGDKKFVELAGLHSGLAVWVPEKDKQHHIDRLVDIRWVFPTSTAAREYLKDQLPTIAEGMPPVKNAPTIGEESYVFGGIYDQPALQIKLRSYIYVFRHGNVVVKLYAAEFDPGGKLRPLTMAPLCQRIVDRIQAAVR